MWLLLEHDDSHSLITVCDFEHLSPTSLLSESSDTDQLVVVAVVDALVGNCLIPMETGEGKTSMANIPQRSTFFVMVHI